MAPHIPASDKYWARIDAGLSLRFILDLATPANPLSLTRQRRPLPPKRYAKVFSSRFSLAYTLAATVQKIVSEILPPSEGVAFAKEARDLLIECCVEFITLISSEANEISEKEAKKTIACDHITKALEQLGFTDYVPAVLEAAAEHKEVQKVRTVCPFLSITH